MSAEQGPEMMWTIDRAGGVTRPVAGRCAAPRVRRPRRRSREERLIRRALREAEAGDTMSLADFARQFGIELDEPTSE